jgi:hypothetical protein
MLHWGDYKGEEYKLGEVGFLVKFTPEKGPERWRLFSRPAHTSQSHEPRLYGWCGNNNNITTDAIGLGRVVKLLDNGRVQFEEIDDPEEIQRHLDDLGYPELAVEIND